MTLPQTAPKINHTEITPGPWRVTSFSIGCNTIFNIHDEFKAIGTVAKEADAHLTAASPDMCEALEYALNNLRKNKNNGLGLAAIQKMKNALALAKGGEGE